MTDLTQKLINNSDHMYLKILNYFRPHEKEINQFL